MRPLTRALTVAAVFALVGAGCAGGLSEGPGEASGPSISKFEGLTPQEATAKINFVPGSAIEMRQTFLGFGANLVAKLAGENKEGVRTIVISRFAPGKVANVEWKLATKVEAESSKKARADAERLKKPVPEPVMVDQVAIGSVDGFNLEESSSLYLPAYWPEKDHAPSFGSSGIWLAHDAYLGLARNRVATLDFGLLDPELQIAISKALEIKGSLSALQGEVAKIENRVDVKVLKGEQDLVEWPLKVNGEEIKVEVIKARSWFGEIVVLNNPQNPLVLKVTLNPVAAGAKELFSGINVLKALVGYEVTALIDVQE